MRFFGTLKTWNDDRGFGFIVPEPGNQQLFVHISAFPRDGRRPEIGERLSFALESGDDGKKRAVKVERLDQSARDRPLGRPAPPTRDRNRRRPARRSRGLGLGIAALLVAGVGLVGYDQLAKLGVLPGSAVMTWSGPADDGLPGDASISWSDPGEHGLPGDATINWSESGDAGASGAVSASRSLPGAAVVTAPQAPRWRCDGRTHCSQMTSCAEATFFLRNCPNVAMDGDSDGIPCERQWCWY